MMVDLPPLPQHRWRQSPRPMVSGTPSGSFFYASARESRHREELACAQLGLEPPNGHFADCVKLLQDNFYAIDNPIT